MRRNSSSGGGTIKPCAGEGNSWGLETNEACLLVLMVPSVPEGVG